MPDNGASVTYRFLPVVRRGHRPSEEFDYKPEADPTGVPARGTVRVELKLEVDHEELPSDQQPSKVELEMVGPDRIVGVDRRQVVRMDPEPDTTDYPPNYFPTVEFAAPDLPWLFSPVRACEEDGKALPWLMLLAVERTEDTRLKRDQGRPLPSIRVPPDELPPPDEAWAWAHAQVVGEIGDDPFTSRSPDTRSRLIAPRNLQPKKPYVAVLVPLFKAGCRVGLGEEPPAGEDEMAYAWTGGESDPVELPVYHSWEFSTGAKGDFEYLVRQLTPRDLSSPEYDVGYARVDVTVPGPEPLEIHTGGRESRTVKLPGALRKPNDEGVEPYQKRGELRDVLNTPQTVTIRDTTYETVGPPVYGSWHALRWQLTEGEHARDQWLYDLNLHPGYRIAAGFGAQIVREKQEQFMASAWEQVGQVREANRWLAAAQLSRAVTECGMSRLKAAGASDGWWLQFTAPAHGRLLTNGKTVAAHIRGSRLPSALLSPAFRRLTSPAGRLARRLDDGLDSAAVAGQVARGNTSLPAPGAGPRGMQTVEGGDDLARLCDEAERLPGDEPPLDRQTEEMLRCVEMMRDDCRALLELLLQLSGEETDEVRDELLDRYVDRWKQLCERVAECETTFEQVCSSRGNHDDSSQDLYARLQFATRCADDGRYLSRDSFTTRRTGARSAFAEPDIAEALLALDEIAGCVATGSDKAYLQKLLCPPPRREAEPVELDVPALMEAFDPAEALIGRVSDRIGGIDLRQRTGDPFDTIMAYPKFPQPMYRDLKDLSEQYLLPGVEEIPQNTVGVLATNPEFIEAFMVGLNHEMAAELQWRRYPTDRRSSYFRQFWDADGRIPKPPDPDDLKDITEIHTWDDKSTDSPASPLGSNTMTGAGGAGGTGGATGESNSRVVLIVRGDLLRRYPDTTIYAAKAEEDSSGDRVPQWATPSEADAEVDRETLRFPIFSARLAPDVTFLGFDLDTREAAGDPGWFFVFEEAPGEPHFGLDAGPASHTPPPGIRHTDENDNSATHTVENGEGAEPGWQGLKWEHIPSDGDPSSIKVLEVEESRPGQEAWRVSAEESQREWTAGEFLPEEMAAEWGRNGAHMAYILWQKPVRIAIHADDLIPTDGEDS